jgi:hypothetical protein
MRRGLEAGLTPAEIVGDDAMDNRSVMVGGREGILGEWGMEIASPSYEGNIPARRALEASKIAATVRFGTGTGLERVLKCATQVRAAVSRHRAAAADPGRLGGGFAAGAGACLCGIRPPGRAGTAAAELRGPDRELRRRGDLPAGGGHRAA